MSVTAKPHCCQCGLIDVHAHCLSMTYTKALHDAGLLSLDGGYPIPQWSAEDAIEIMNGNGIDTMLLSVSSPSVGFLKGKKARMTLARTLNEEAAFLSQRYPGRFGGFATLPFPDVQACLDEIHYALGVLKLDGVVIETNVEGKYLGSTDFAPIFDELNKYKAVVFLHPTSPGCFESVGLGRPAPLFEFPVDTARTVVDLIFSDTLVRCPDIRLILPHAGGVIPAIAQRIALLSNLPVMKPAPKSGAKVIAEFKRLYYDLAMSANQPTFDSLRTLAPLSQIVFGTDYPFQPSVNVACNVANFRALDGLSGEEHEAIARHNALKLFPRLAPLVGY